MAIYLFELSVIPLLAFITSKIKLKNPKKTFIIISFFIIILIAGLRKYTVGIDLEGQYARTYTMIATMDWKTAFSLRYEPGYIVFCKLLSIVSSDHQFYIFVTSIISFGSIAYFIYKNSEDVYMSTFLFITLNFMYNYMNIIRQVLALSIMLFGISFLKKRNYLIFALLVILASTIHTSAIIALILIPFSIIKYKKGYLYISFAFLGLSIVFGGYIFNIASSIIGKYASYETKGSLGMSVINSYTVLNTILILLLFILASKYLINHNSYEHKSKNNLRIASKKTHFYSGRVLLFRSVEEEFSNDFLVFMIFFSTIFRSSVLSISIFCRLMVYFQPFILLAVPKIIDNISNKNKNFVKYLIYLFFLLYFIYTSMHTSKINFGTIPYCFYWQ